MEYKDFNFLYLNQVVDLLNLCFPKNNITKNSFLWKHFDVFFKNKSLGMIAINNKKVCAFVCFVPTIINKNNSFYSFYLCAVQCTHPKYRRRGIISDLTKLAEDKLGNKINYIGFSNKDGIKIDKYSKKINYQILGKFTKKFILFFPYKTDLNLKIQKVNKISKEIFCNSNYFSILKNNTYLKWRYEKNPKNKYEYFEVKNKNKIIGYIICKKYKISYEVHDLIFDSYDANLYNLIIKSFSKFAFLKGKLITSYSFLINTFWNKCFSSTFSFSKKTSTHLTIKTKIVDLKNTESWILQKGDIL